MLKTFDIYYDISPLYLVELDKHLRACATDKEINLNICSPGGDIYAGIAIAEKLRACGKRVNARVWGYAASAAFTIACACDFVEASPLTHFMVHSAYTWGGIDDGCKHANESQLALIHRKNADYTERDLLEDRWFTASEAQAFGLVDRIVEFEGDAEAKRAAAYGFSKFRNIGGDTMKAEEMKKEEVIDEKKAEELTPDTVDEKVEDQLEQKVDDKSDDLIEQVIERIEELTARVAALEEKREAECGPSDEKKAKLAARLASISRPVERVVATEEEKNAQNAAKDLERFKAAYGNSFDRFIRG